MADFQKVEIAHIPHGLCVYATLYTNLRNAKELLSELRNQNHELEYTFLDARKILSFTVLQAAIFRAINDSVNNRMKSHNVHSEVVLSLNLNNNIGESYRKFGMTEQTKDLLVVKITEASSEQISQQLARAVDADQQALNGDSSIRSLADLAEIRKLYKLKGIRSKDSHADPPESPQDILQLETTVLGLIALRGAS